MGQIKMMFFLGLVAILAVTTCVEGMPTELDLLDTKGGALELASLHKNQVKYYRK